MDLAMTQDALTTRQSTPTVPTTCSEVKGSCLSFTFDGQNCIYEGPTNLEPGRTTLLFLNESEEVSSLEIGRHGEDKTIQDMIDYIEYYRTVFDYPSPMPLPSWWQYRFFDCCGRVIPGSSSMGEVYLQPGIYTVICFNGAPRYQYFGTGITVVDQGTTEVLSTPTSEVDSIRTPTPAGDRRQEQVHTNADQGVSIYYPHDWLALEEMESGLTLLPTNEPADDPRTYMWVLYPDIMIQPELASDTPLEDTLSTLAFYLRNEDLQSLGSVKRGENHAFIHFTGSMDDRPVKGLIGVVQNGEYFVGLFGFTNDDSMLSVMESIVADVQIETPVFMPSDDALLLTPGTLYEETDSNKDQVRNYRFAAAKNEEFILAVRGDPEGGILKLEVFDMDGVRVFRDAYITDFVESVEWLTANKDGEYHLEITGSGDARLLILPIQLDEPSAIISSTETLTEDEVAEFAFEDVQGDWLIAYAKVVGPEADSTSLNLELYEDEQMVREHHVPSLEAATILVDVSAPNYWLHVYETDGQPITYTLFVFAPEILD
jgi:hypothetical protein